MSHSIEKKLDDFFHSINICLENKEKGLTEPRFAQRHRSEDSIPSSFGLVGTGNPSLLSLVTGVIICWIYMQSSNC